MCGIAGILGLRRTYRVDGDDIKRMCSALVHRGPDDEGIYTEDCLGIGMRRLSVIDVEAGRQPISNEDETVFVVFNGEIYNFPSLRRQLIERGHRFKTRTDTEVIVHLYEDHGTGCVKFLRGMFAFAVWDKRRKSLLLARDRMGQKPLYYCADSERLIFASEIKAILTCSETGREVDPAAVAEYLHFGYVSSHRSIYRDIRKLRPAHILKAENGKVMSPCRYWEMPWPNPTSCSERHYLTELNSRLEESVRLRLVSDVPIGAFLSGGVDSSVITAVMSDVAENTIETFNVGFSEMTFDERRKARQIASLFRTNHHSNIMKYDASELLHDVVAQFDEPFADDSALPTYLLSKYTRQGVTVALSGDGGDELFGGYMRYLARRFMGTYLLLPRPLRRILEKTVDKLPDRTDYFMESLLKQLRLFVRMAKNIEQKEAYPIPYIFGRNGHLEILSHDCVARGERCDDSSVDKLEEEYGSLDQITKMMWLDMNMYLCDDILTKVDRMSMAHSLEVRCPFLDHELVEFAATVPTSLKIRGTKTKYLLKKYAAQRIPKSIVRQRKHGFNFPVGQWLKTSLKPLLKEIFLCDDNIYFLNQDVARNLLNEHWSGKRDHSKKIWNLLVLAVWNLQQKKVL